MHVITDGDNAVSIERDGDHMQQALVVWITMSGPPGAPTIKSAGH